MLFFKAIRTGADDRKAEMLRAMSRADLADIGLKPGDLPRVIAQIDSRRAR
jgi:uncharacterized protein YjiS (DUF1127 family)